MIDCTCAIVKFDVYSMGWSRDFIWTKASTTLGITMTKMDVNHQQSDMVIPWESMDWCPWNHMCHKKKCKWKIYGTSSIFQTKNPISNYIIHNKLNFVFRSILQPKRSTIMGALWWMKPLTIPFIVNQTRRHHEETFRENLVGEPCFSFQVWR